MVEQISSEILTILSALYLSWIILKDYQYRSDINMPHDNIWQTKLRIREDFGPERYLLDPKDIHNPEVPEKMSLLMKEMREVFHLLH